MKLCSQIISKVGSRCKGAKGKISANVIYNMSLKIDSNLVGYCTVLPEPTSSEDPSSSTVHWDLLMVLAVC